jgi:catalase
MSQRRESTERAEAAVPPPSAEPILVPRGSKVPAQDSEFLTTSTGVRLHHTDDSLKAGSRGPTLMDDFHLREKIMHFDHERIPERVVHARGVGVHGIFESYGNATEFTSAGFLRPGVVTPVFTRFSTVVGSRGSADTVRDVRGFAVKFYTDEGNFDLVGNNIPVFFIRDGIKFPDLVHAAKPEPDREIPQAQTAHSTFWDFVSAIPESPHMLMWVMSDRAIPRSYRMMEGFGVHTFRLVNEAMETCSSSSTGSRCSASTAWCGRRPRPWRAWTRTSTAATSTTRSAQVRSPSGSSACRSCPTPRTRCSRASISSTRPRSCPRSSFPCSRSAA